MTMSDDDTFSLLKTGLFTAVVGDVLDVLGFHHQFLPAGIAPLKPGMKIAGRAMPVLEADIFSDGTEGSSGPLAQKPFGLMLEALDDLKQGEVYIATGASLNYAIWGGLMSTRATHLKAAGAILDGYVRDVGEIEALGFNTFCRGVYAQDQGVRGKVIDFRSSIIIGGIRIAPGDLIFGDSEGVLVIPRAAETEVLRMAQEKASTENVVATAIKNGMPACEAFSTYGVM
ncbi:MAG TPA: RraA family protein [Devosia sp.]|nr:RraA family protein [Devosia sp.]